jgi:hypothetical protein
MALINCFCFYFPSCCVLACNSSSPSCRTLLCLFTLLSSFVKGGTTVHFEFLAVDIVTYWSFFIACSKDWFCLSVDFLYLIFCVNKSGHWDFCHIGITVLDWYGIRCQFLVIFKYKTSFYSSVLSDLN